MTVNAADITIAGMIRPDGSLELEQQPNLPPGPVQVTLRSIPVATRMPRRPDEPWPDESVPAPFDLPRPAPARRVHPRRATLRLPDTAFIDDCQQ
jgi:hypothetical protein